MWSPGTPRPAKLADPDGPPPARAPSGRGLRLPQLRAHASLSRPGDGLTAIAVHSRYSPSRRDFCPQMLSEFARPPPECPVKRNALSHNPLHFSSPLPKYSQPPPDIRTPGLPIRQPRRRRSGSTVKKCRKIWPRQQGSKIRSHMHHRIRTRQSGEACGRSQTIDRHNCGCWSTRPIAEGGGRSRRSSRRHGRAGATVSPLGGRPRWRWTVVDAAGS